MKILFTDCPKKAKNKEDDNTSNNIHVEVSFNLTALVSWTTVILEGFCVMAWNIMKCIILNVVSDQSPVVRTPVSTNPRLNFNPRSFIFLSRALSRIIFSILFSVSNHQIVGKDI